VTSHAALVLLAAAAVALTTLGCVPRESAEIEIYRSVLDAGLDSTATDASEPLDTEIGVADVMLLASRGNESLAIEGETYLQSLIDRRRAASAFLPTLTLAPSYTWRDSSSNSSPDEDAINTPLRLDAALSPVRDVAVLRQSGSTVEQRRALLLDFQDTLLLDTARTHYSVILAERAVDVLENSLEVQEERVDDARVRLDAGIIGPLDVSLTESQSAQTAATLIEAKARVRTGRSTLEVLAAAPIAETKLVDDLEIPKVLPELDAALVDAAKRRQDLVAAARQMEAAGHRVRSAYGQYFPSVTLNLQYFLQRDSDPTNLHWSSLLQMSLPLFSAGLIEADVRESLSLLRQAKLAYSLTEREVRRDVEVALTNLRASFDRVEQGRVQVRSAGDALEQAEGLYNAGLSTNLERLIAQDRLLAAQLELVIAEADTKVFYLDLRRTTGTLHELIGLERADDTTEQHAKAR
jgi:outer membrane protein TolC